MLNYVQMEDRRIAMFHPGFPLELHHFC